MRYTETFRRCVTRWCHNVLCDNLWDMGMWYHARDSLDSETVNHVILYFFVCCEIFAFHTLEKRTDLEHSWYKDSRNVQVHPSANRFNFQTETKLHGLQYINVIHNYLCVAVMVVPWTSYLLFDCAIVRDQIVIGAGTHVISYSTLSLLKTKSIDVFLFENPVILPCLCMWYI